MSRQCPGGRNRDILCCVGPHAQVMHITTQQSVPCGFECRSLLADADTDTKSESTAPDPYAIVRFTKTHIARPVARINPRLGVATLRRRCSGYAPPHLLESGPSGVYHPHFKAHHGFHLQMLLVISPHGLRGFFASLLAYCSFMPAMVAV